MERVKTRAIVARRADYSESNCMLTLFAEGLGVISASVYGIKSNKSRMRACCQLLCFAEFVLIKGKGDIYRAESAEIIETFYPISEDVKKLALAGYFLEVIGDSFSAEDPQSLTLLLNTLYALSYKDIDCAVAKAVFELKIMQYSGYEPNLETCIRCGKAEKLISFDFVGGTLCRDCSTHFAAGLLPDVKEAMRYILKSDIKRLFSFILPEPAKASLSEICEKYILSKSEKHYKSLEYYKKIM
ncbi:MAG: DNA repair protein RecO [Firmicutes bacterium]|nr:DNA repair protein RecO [Bacillota bacterium]